MTMLNARIARKLLVVKAARELKKEIEKAGIDNLKTLAEAGKSIVTIYLNGCSDQEKVRIRRELNALQHLGVTPDMLLSEVARQLPEIAPIMEGKEDYKKTEVQKLDEFLKGGVS